MVDNDMTSDILIYNILANSTDEAISDCNLKFIDQSVPAQEDDTIYIASVDLETLEEMFDEVKYKALVNIYVKTKDTDYVDASRFLRTVIKHIKNVLRSNDDCKERYITFRNTTYEYGSGYALKGMHLLVQMLEFESNDLSVDYENAIVNADNLKIELKD